MRRLVLGVVCLVDLCGPLAAQENWPVFTSKQFGLSIAYPDHLVDYPASRPAKGEFALKGGGRLVLTMDDLHGRDLKSFLQEAFLKDVDVTYQRRKGGWMAYSGYAAGEIVYGRTHISCGGRYAHTFLIRYPEAERSTYDPVVERLSHSLKVSPQFTAASC
ncbi:hypothetical protein IZ6_27490 [Terrihabitans soli]|uniref:Uncharacterized protein n=1 Tax=Terrihabitans soli TaxID=708113 RepID=A0A6S6QNC5_9HYPH|nr:hypothetical protein [Terrihabitans soli]BCJ92014.1 hypothetical protein IZ6_27490 [Terrihabitans soli]